MNTSSFICLTLFLSIGLASNVEAAKENFDRSKPHVRAGNGLDNDCNGKRATRVCTPQQLTGKHRCDPITFPNSTISRGPTNSQQTKAAQPSKCVKPMTPPTPSFVKSPIKPPNGLQSNGTKAHDYNSSRSNKNSVKRGGDDLILRKRPGRTKYTPPGNCPKPKMGVKSPTNPDCPTSKQ